MMESILQNPKCVYRTDGYFPNTFKRNCYRFKNALHNRLYPISPMFFSIIFVVIASFLYKNPPKQNFLMILREILHEQIAFMLNILLVSTNLALI
ncbi:putative integral membrane protein [Acanthocheilonema viteae]